MAESYILKLLLRGILKLSWLNVVGLDINTANAQRSQVFDGCRINKRSPGIGSLPNFLRILLSTQKDGRPWCGNHIKREASRMTTAANYLN